MALLCRRWLGIDPAELDALSDEDWTARVGEALWLEEREAEMLARAVNRGIARSFGQGEET